MAGSMIEFTANGGKAAGYLARPETPNGKGIIVLQEWWGLVPHIQDLADRFATLGYLALAPDLWDGQKTTSPDEAGRLFMALNVHDATAKLAGAATALAKEGARGKLGVIGFCMGGQLALYAAGALPEVVGACVDFYGVHPNVRPNYAAIQAPVLGIFGEKDPSVTPQTGREIAAAIAAAGGRCETHVFPAGHAFFNDARPEAYDAPSAAAAWRLTTQFFATNLS